MSGRAASEEATQPERKKPRQLTAARLRLLLILVLYYELTIHGHADFFGRLP